MVKPPPAKVVPKMLKKNPPPPVQALGPQAFKPREKGGTVPPNENTATGSCGDEWKIQWCIEIDEHMMGIYSM